jgi:uncharacterized repeat protein (TIGR01451 family)
MLLPLALVLASHSTPIAKAETADVAVTIVAPDSVDSESPITFATVVTNRGPGNATNVQLTTAIDSPTRLHCTKIDPVPFFPTDFEYSQSCVADALNGNGTLTITASVTASSGDPNPANSTATKTVRWIVGPDLAVHGSLLAQTPLDPGVSSKLVVSYSNLSKLDATNVAIRVAAPSDFTFASLPDFCSASGGVLTCNVGTVKARTGIPITPTNPSFTVDVVSPAGGGGGNFNLALSIAGSEEEGNTANNRQTISGAVFRTFVVSDANALADAIQSANAECTGAQSCKVLVDAGKIELQSQLPAITAWRTIIQSRANTLLDGKLLDDGTAFTIAGCSDTIDGFAIGNFGDSAVHITANPCGSPNVVQNSKIGVAIDGVTPMPNGRGIVATGAVFIRDNIISANTHSGIFYVGRDTAMIDRNTIGLNINHQPLGNGNSGIFLGAPARLTGNFIAFNRQFGVAIARTTFADIEPNSIFANGILGIDIGLDGPSVEAISPPTILSAHYDPTTDKTIVDLPGDVSGIIQLYASDAPHPSGFGDGQYYLGTFGGVTPLAAKGDWRGKWISATFTQFQKDTIARTSEFSRAVPVQ